MSIHDDIHDLWKGIRGTVENTAGAGRSFEELMSEGLEALAELDDDNDLSDEEKRNIVLEATGLFLASLVSESSDGESDEEPGFDEP